MKFAKFLPLILMSVTLHAGDGIPLTEFAKQGTVVTAPDGRGKVVEIRGATQFPAKILGAATPSPFSNTRCVYFFARKYHKLKDGSFEVLDVQSSENFDGVAAIGKRLVRPDIVDFSKKFRPTVRAQGDIQTEEYCLAPNQTYPMVIRVFGSAQPPDENDHVKTTVYYHAEFGPQNW